MANVKNLSGKTFGRLSVISRTDRKKGHCYLWLCRCSCGNEVLVRTYFLTHGITRSCGCLQADARKYDLSGQRFGRLAAIRSTGKQIHNCYVWECKCDCGKIAYVRSDHLARGITKSCGCLHKDTAVVNSKDIYLVNLRDDTNIALIKSGKLYSNNTSGCKGVNWHKGTGMWQARIQFRKINYHLGYYSNINDAITARKTAELQYFGEFLDKPLSPPGLPAKLKEDE